MKITEEREKEIKEAMKEHILDITSELFHDYSSFDNIAEELALTDEEIDYVRNVDYDVIVNI